MAVKMIRLLYCDTPRDECPRDGEPYDYHPDPDEWVREQRKRARKDGWTRKGGEDFCPDCSE